MNAEPKPDATIENVVICVEETIEGPSIELVTPEDEMGCWPNSSGCAPDHSCGPDASEGSDN